MIACARDKLSKSEGKNLFDESSQWEIYLAVSSDLTTTVEEITLTPKLALKELAWVLESVRWQKRRNPWQIHTAKKTEVKSYQDYIASSIACRTAKSADTKSYFCKAAVSSAANIPNIHPTAALSHPLNLFFEQVVGTVHKAQCIHVKNALQVHCHQCHIHFKPYFPKVVALALAGTDRKKNMPRWVPFLFDGLTAPMHSVNLLQGQFMDLVAWKTFQENKIGVTFKRSS